MASLLQQAVAKLGERSGEAIGGVYARVAGSLQQRLERLEDLNAERRYHQRSNGRVAASPAALQLAAPVEGNESPGTL